MKNAANQSLCTGESGAAMLETAIVLPVLLFLMFGIFEFGLAFARAQVLSNAAREGAREASLFRRDCEDGPVTGSAKAAALDTGARLGMSRDAITVNVTNVCDAGAQVLVTVDYTHELPVLNSLASFIGGDAMPAQLKLHGQAQMLNEMR